MEEVVERIFITRSLRAEPRRIWDSMLDLHSLIGGHSPRLWLAARPGAIADSRIVLWKVGATDNPLQWQEEQVFDFATKTIHFRQLQGIFTRYSGCWQVAAVPGGCSVMVEFQIEPPPAAGHQRLLADFGESLIDRWSGDCRHA